MSRGIIMAICLLVIVTALCGLALGESAVISFTSADDLTARVANE